VTVWSNFGAGRVFKDLDSLSQRIMLRAVTTFSAAARKRFDDFF
jgi:hypothetical protein